MWDNKQHKTSQRQEEKCQTWGKLINFEEKVAYNKIINVQNLKDRVKNEKVN